MYIVEPPIEIELTTEEVLYYKTLDLERRLLELEDENQALRRTMLQTRQEAFLDHLRRELGADLGGELILDLERRKAFFRHRSERADVSSTA